MGLQCCEAPVPEAASRAAVGGFLSGDLLQRKLPSIVMIRNAHIILC